MAKLLLKADGILRDTWCPLDPPPPYEPPERWDGPHVAHRFAEAIGTLLKLPLGQLGPRAITKYLAPIQIGVGRFARATR